MGNGVSVNSTPVGIAIGFVILGILFTIGIVQFCYKYKCKQGCKKKKKKGKSLKDKVINSEVSPEYPQSEHSVSFLCSTTGLWLFTGFLFSPQMFILEQFLYKRLRERAGRFVLKSRPPATRGGGGGDSAVSRGNVAAKRRKVVSESSTTTVSICVLLE
ncbi:hypothetical protein EYF80_038381 [Liparis tanakae]|uniref:Uncharacterized protein n=1 Tax=Liparis tanakae TaxID=230148 RepID=A0A4Z2GCY2_9TELE|nr:hypothetical protein EYF80_038381 [Liparis tanakae]